MRTCTYLAIPDRASPFVSWLAPWRKGGDRFHITHRLGEEEGAEERGEREREKTSETREGVRHGGGGWGWRNRFSLCESRMSATCGLAPECTFPCYRMTVPTAAPPPTPLLRLPCPPCTSCFFCTAMSLDLKRVHSVKLKQHSERPPWAPAGVSDGPACSVMQVKGGVKGESFHQFVN